MQRTLELGEYERRVHVYTDNPIDGTFHFKDFPRDSKEERQRLKDLGIFFLRDADDFFPIFGINSKDSKQCFYYDLLLTEDGKVEYFYIKDQATIVEWIDGGKVKRKFL